MVLVQRDSVVLEDGSTALLGPASLLLVRGNEVELSGEAFLPSTATILSPVCSWP